MEKKWLVFCLLAVFFFLAIMSMRNNSATSDEVTHIASGYSYWKYFDYTFNQEHPPLVKLWATVPLLFMNPALPEEPTLWTGDQWNYAKTFLYSIDHDADSIYFWSRFMMVLIGIVLGYYVYRWASELYGWKAGILALTFYVFDPNILAHSTIVHTDIPITAALFILLYYFWKWSQQESLNWKQIGVLGVLLGIALAVKFTGLYVLPIIFILSLVHLYYDRYSKEQEQKEHNFFARIDGFYAALQGEVMKKELTRKMRIFGIIFCIGVFVLTLTYGFVHISSYFVGLASVAKQSTATWSSPYLLGMNSTDGWWYYFIVAFFVKTPAPTLLLLFATLYLFFKIKQTEKNTWRDALFLLIPAALYFLAFIPSKYNIGMRHILPIYPFLFVFMSSVVTVHLDALGERLSGYTQYAKYLLLFLVAWLMMSTVFAYPYFLPYFNDFVGGSKNGYKYLLDSNLDWGQGLKETAAWLDEHGYSNTTIRMSTFGNEDPAYRGITYQKIMCAPTPGIHVISANKLYDFQGNQYGCTDWLLNYEPVAIIGYSIYIYIIDDPIVAEQYAGCKTECSKGCIERGQAYGDSLFKDQCICICTDATNEELGIV